MCRKLQAGPDTSMTGLAVIAWLGEHALRRDGAGRPVGPGMSGPGVSVDRNQWPDWF